MTPYYPIPYSVDDTWILIHTWACLIMVYKREGNAGVAPLTCVGMVGWYNGEIEVLEGVDLPLDEIRAIFERSEEQR